MADPTDDRERPERYWFARHSTSIIFLICILAVIGVYEALTLPVAVFPTTNFPRIIIGVDNGVTPIEQMEVSITRPLEEAVRSVPGLETVRSVTSRGSAEINLFFNWSVDMITTLQEDFITMAKAKGLTNRRILWRHALRPSSFTLLTAAALNFGALIGGAVVIEFVFQLPGMGLGLITAVSTRQYTAVQAYVALIAVAFVLFNAFVDGVYSVLDPRIRHARTAAA